MAVRTYLDTGVLIAAAAGKRREQQTALAVLEDPDRIFLTSPFVELEVLPHAERDGTPEQVAFYRRFFQSCESTDDLRSIVALAAQELRRTNLQLIDAFHVAAASLLEADELITTEGAGKPIHRNTLVKVKRLVLL